jgi:protein involved in polysaccharide export with SLBB domain
MFNSFLKSLGLYTLQSALAVLLCCGVQAQTRTATTGSGSTLSLVATEEAALTSPTLAASREGAFLQPEIQQLAMPRDTAKPVAQDVQSGAVRAHQADRKLAPPNQFQRFVQEATGRLLPMYGRNLFDNREAYGADAAIPAPADYVLGAGDEVRLQVWGPENFYVSLTIDRNGQVNLPKVGVLTLAGVSVRDLEKTLRAHLGKVFTNFQASASMGRLRGIQVYVVGQAQLPGTYHLSSLSTLVNALFASGGPSVNGSMRHIELKRADKTVSTLDLYDFIARGDKSHDLPLLSGDTIVIPPVGPRVAVTGAFDQAAIFELKASATSVGDILTLGGGVPALAKSQKALLERITRDSKRPRQVQEIVLDEQGLRQPLIDGDVLTLLDISPAFENAVTLQGVVAEPLRYRWFEGMKILDLIPDREVLITSDYYKRKNRLVQKMDTSKETGNNAKDSGRDASDADSNAKVAGSTVDTRIRNIADQINWEYAVIERMDHSKLSTELIPFNLGKAVLQHDPAHNLTLQAGDVVTILSQNDLRLPQDRQARLVRVEGEVAAPGVYQAAPGETLPQLLQRIGGLTAQAYLFGSEFNRESVRQRQQENLDVLIRRMEAQSQSQAGVLIANRGTDNAGQALALQQQQQTQLKSQIERLKSAKSSGRMALELDPKAQTLASLPDLPLEDGDRILVPSRPGFVSAFGSVNNENVFIYRPGKTVGDVIKSAGLTEDAEPDQAFVLRADGSIMARRDHSGLFGGSFESIQVMPGDALVVPAQIDRESRYNMITRGVKDWSQILSNFGLGIASLRAATKL